MLTYTTLDGETLDLSELSDEEQAFLECCLRAWRENMPFDKFVSLIWGVENPVVRELGRGRVTKAV